MFEDANQAARQHHMAALGLHRRWVCPTEVLTTQFPTSSSKARKSRPAAIDADEPEAADLLEVVPLEANPADAAGAGTRGRVWEDDYR
jgi:hypothetical protein